MKKSASMKSSPSTFISRRWISVTFLSAAALWILKNRNSSYILCSQTKNIYTVDDANPKVECIYVKGSHVVDVGDYSHIEQRSVPFDFIRKSVPSWIILNPLTQPKVFEVSPDAVVVPGLADAHAHVIENGYMMQLPLMGAQSVQDVVDRIKAFITSHPDVENDKSRWIEGMGWDQTKWPGARFPTAADLNNDPLLKGRLISLSRVDGHARWVSFAVLNLMKDLPEKVDGGLVVRDKEGRPTGIFVDNAMGLIPTPPWGEAQISDFFNLTIKQALSYGLTSIHDADTKLEHIKFFQKMADAGKLPSRLYLMGNVASEEYWGHQIPRLINYGKHKRLNLRSVKLFTDGALGSWGAALLKPYSDKPETSGLMLSSPETLKRLVDQFWKDGWQTSIHCIGDRANHAILDIYEDILEHRKGNVTEWRPRIEHAQIFAPEDLERIGKLGVIASVQPTHATSDMWYAEIRLGAERIKGAYAYQTLLKASPTGVLPLGSDFPVEGVNPLLGFYAATSRLSVDGTSPHGSGGWFANQRLSREQALKGMTLDAAYASFAEHETGSLTPGKKADFVVFDRNIMTVPFEEILKAKVQATVVDGQVMYGWAYAPVRRGEQRASWASRLSQSPRSRSSQPPPSARPMAPSSKPAELLFLPLPVDHASLAPQMTAPLQHTSAPLQHTSAPLQHTSAPLQHTSAPALQGEGYSLPTIEIPKTRHSLNHHLQVDKAAKRDEPSAKLELDTGAAPQTLRPVEEANDPPAPEVEAEMTADSWGDSFAVEWIRLEILPFP
ncbi:unnamed protein product [Cyclocybe aegerita]|uniref:Amidohydrolase 3 domain-containing protein n=1 Tax=Cyclocybe aegerita TaxID=1973307 RepID=A0A8S0WYM3_CYCAE|nr:unnamed protein product [Cyclocybe aegerita]